MKTDANPMSPAQRLREAPRCTATSKRTGERCKGPAVRGWPVCRFHGAGGGHGTGKVNPAYRHGLRSREWVEMRGFINELVRETRESERLVMPQERQ